MMWYIKGGLEWWNFYVHILNMLWPLLDGLYEQESNATTLGDILCDSDKETTALRGMGYRWLFPSAYILGSSYTLYSEEKVIY